MCICGRDDCNGMCDTKIGERIVRFFDSNLIAESHIGETMDYNGEEYSIYQCEGYPDGTSCKKYKKVKIEFTKKKVFEPEFNEVNLDSCVEKFHSAYLKAYDRYKSRVDGIPNNFTIREKSFRTLSGIESGSLHLVPFHFGSKVVFPYKSKGAKGKATEAVGIIRRTSWGYDIDNKKEYMAAIVEINDKENVNVNMEGFPNKVRALDSMIKPAGFRKVDIVSLDVNGMFKPFLYKIPTGSLILDGFNLYFYKGEYKNVDRSKVKIVMSWEDGMHPSPELSNKVGYKLKSKDLGLLEGLIEYIRPYKHLLIPYGCTPVNILGSSEKE